MQEMNERSRKEKPSKRGYLEGQPKFHRRLKAVPSIRPDLPLSPFLSLFVRLCVSHAWRAFPAPFSSAAPALNACLTCHTATTMLLEQAQPEAPRAPRAPPPHLLD